MIIRQRLFLFYEEIAWIISPDNICIFYNICIRIFVSKRKKICAEVGKRITD